MQDDQEHAKRISFLATGSEIVEGEVQDSNGALFAKIIHEQGGVPFQRMLVSDRKLDIERALTYLLETSEAVIVMGGLGPTSDDTTRFAVADVIEQPLVFNDASWARLTERLKKFNLPVSAANQQQSLFPADAILLPNKNGTADGAHIVWRNKQLFMLPGPPRECVPLFEHHVLPVLKEQGFFTARQHYRWLTLGLLEGVIAPCIDELAKDYAVETGFRWHYPYLEIKISSSADQPIASLIATVESELAPYLVSQDGRDALAVLAEVMGQQSQPIQLIDELSPSNQLIELPHAAIQRIAPTQGIPSGVVVKIQAFRELNGEEAYSGTMTLTCEGYFQQKKVYEHHLPIPNRGPEVADFGKVYLAWQIIRVLQVLKTTG